MGKKRKEEIPKPLLCRHCKRCGSWFIATHPKDTQEYCEKCREHRGQNAKEFCQMQKEINEEAIETVAQHCKHIECIYRSQIDGGNTPICFYAVLAGEPRRCKISECDKYKDGRKVRPRMEKDYIIWWERELYDEDADFIWRGYW